MLVADSHCLKQIFEEKIEFKDKFPVIYKYQVHIENDNHKCGGCYTVSPIDVALKKQQYTAIQRMIEFIVEYQNDYTSSFLFLDNFPAIA